MLTPGLVPRADTISDQSGGDRNRYASARGDDGARDLDLLLAKLKVDIAAVTADHADIARKAFRRYGRGRHAANLNFGDCFAYALAKIKSASLLFEGDDFGRTDVMVAPY